MARGFGSVVVLAVAEATLLVGAVGCTPGSRAEDAPLLSITTTGAASTPTDAAPATLRPGHEHPDAATAPVAVLFQGRCLIGQYGPASGGYHSAVRPALGTGGCLVGQTRPIDW